ncbi:hypothetical protein Rsub_05717 [Raphidocelis subcapitata]|uniref:Calcineurin-like phosphoesterase domain-containing protein n=1 Tax=Raphidocelis subcapitata TaxID=307507 RepID=A0A2V0NZR6_9CHLO|nr:hypothetical protein Rsub_05717 [Raphidocelis subcapitata]|eukprot:GBF93106.1 hypothetical protein Rsub_05717 [Raphidocelis subcapitata]
MAAQPLFTLAVVADIQYADKGDGHFEARTQRFREAPAKLRAAVDAMLAEHAGDGTGGIAGSGGGGCGGLAAALSLGDIVDGYGDAPDAAARAASDLEFIAAELERLEGAGVPLRHVPGNHCFAVPRGALLRRLGFPAGSSGYYSAPLGPGWRLIALDTTDVSLFGHEEGTPNAAEARRWLGAHPTSEHPNAQTWNGGLSAQQFAWLRAELAAAKAEGQRAVVACHHPLAPGSAPAHYLAWDHAAIRAALESAPGTAAFALTGHYHPGGACEVNGIHYVTLEGLVEASTGSNAFAFVDFFADRVEIRGHGAATSRVLPLPAA